MNNTILVADDSPTELRLVIDALGKRGYQTVTATDGEDAIEKKSTMDTYWVPGVNHLGSHGRWAFAEFTEVFAVRAVS